MPSVAVYPRRGAAATLTRADDNDIGRRVANGHLTGSRAPQGRRADRRMAAYDEARPSRGLARADVRDPIDHGAAVPAIAGQAQTPAVARVFSRPQDGRGHGIAGLEGQEAPIDDEVLLGHGQPRSSSLMLVLDRVWASTRFTMTAQLRLWLPSAEGRLPATTTDPVGTRP